MRNKAVLLNMIANVLSFMVSTAISFFLTPYITKHAGMEAYGIIGLANSFINYISIITVALNSMASRFVIIELHKNNFRKANEYFSSVLLANTIMVLLLVIPAIVLIININVLNISSNLIFDAQITFAIILINFIISLLGSYYGIVLYAKNMLWKGSIRTLESNILRVLLIFAFFSLVDKKIYFVVFATLLAGLYCVCFNVYYTKKNLSELKVKRVFFKIKAIKELVMAGIWNSITKLSQVLLDGLDLLLSNIFIDGTMTGNVSVAKTIPSLYTTVSALLSDSFYPEFLEFYSKGMKKELLESIKKSITILSSISGICLSMLIVYAKDFYILWLPEGETELLSVLTVLGTGTVLVSGCIYSLFSIFSLTNKIKNNSIALLVTGIFSTLTTFLCLRFTDLGVYAIVGISSIYGILRNLTFTPIYAAKCLDIHKFSFYPTILKNLLNIGILIAMEIVVRTIIPVASWGHLVLNGIISVIFGSILTVRIMFSKEQRDELFQRVKHLVKR